MKLKFPAGKRLAITQRHRNCLAAIWGGNTIGLTDADVYSEVARTDRTVTQAEVRDLLGELRAWGLIENAFQDRTRWVVTPKGRDLIES